MAGDSLNPDSAITTFLLKASAIFTAILVIVAFLKKVYKSFKNVWHLADRIKTISDELAPENKKGIKEIVDELAKTVYRVENRQLVKEYREKVVLQESSLIFFEFDANGDLIWANQQYCDLAGRPLSELLGKGWENTVIQEDRERIHTEFKRSVKDKRNFESQYTIFNLKYEKKIKVSSRVVAVKNNDTSLLGWIGIMKII